MQERRKDNSAWFPYIDILPKSYSNFPIFFDETERQWLEGSPFLDQIAEKVLILLLLYTTL
jgi:histone-lysine N-methyltransferase SETD3